MANLRIVNGAVLTMDSQDRLIEDGEIRVEDARITYVGPAQKEIDPTPGETTVDAGGGIIMPGLINSHTHASMTLFRGLADDLPLMDWLNDHIFPAERNLTGDAVYWGAMLAITEMIRNGVTSFCDMYLFAPRVAEAVAAGGLRAVVGEVIYDFPSPGYGELENGFRVTEDLIAQYQDHPRITGAVMPHALYTCSPSLLQRAARLSADTGCDVNIHMSESAAETAGILQNYGKRPLAHLSDMGLLSPRLWIDHGVDLNQEEIEQLAAAGARVAHCPESNMKLASGIAPLPAMLAAGLAVGLGTDGCASNNDLDLFGEMDTCAKLHKVAALDPTAAPAQAVLAMATSQGAKAFGQPDIGALAPGNLADIIIVDTNQPHLTPMYDPKSHLVYAARGGDVSHTICHGEILMANRQLTRLDETEALAKAREQAALLTGRAC